MKFAKVEPPRLMGQRVQLELAEDDAKRLRRLLYSHCGSSLLYESIATRVQQALASAGVEIAPRGSNI